MAKVLLVEDDNNLREIYEARLQAEGYNIVAAQDGEEALVIAKKEQPDLIISDVMMPRISGFEMLDILRNTDGMKDVKVIMLTALGQAEDKTRADSLGADRYLVKSQVTLEDIVKAAGELLSGAPSVPAMPAASTADATPAPAANPTITTATEPMSVAAAPPESAPAAPAPAPAVTPAPAAVPEPAVALEPATPAPAPVAPAAPEPASPAAPAAPVVPPAAPAPPVITPIPAPQAPMPDASANAAFADTVKDLMATSGAPEPIAAPGPMPSLAPAPEPPAAVTPATTPSPAPAPEPLQSLVTPASAVAPASPATPVVPPELVTAPAPFTIPVSSAPAPAAPAPSTPAPAPQSVTLGGNRVIQPLPPTGEPRADLSDLLAKEGISNMEQNPASEATGTPHPPGHVISPNPVNDQGKPLDPNSIAL